jgi:hypothetical protein
MAYDDGTLRYEARTFVARTGGAPERSATFWTVDIVNRRNRAATATLRAVFMGLQSLAYQVVQPVDLHCRRAEGGRLILTGRKVCLVAPAGGAFAAGIENVLRYRLSLTAGGRARLTFVIPRFDCSPADGRGLARVDPDAAFREMRREWRAILARGSRVRLPDARFNRLYRSLVIHGFINAEGDRMPYGAFPSQYNHTVFGVEEGWLMTALASFGFGADALRYCAGTYLTPGHFDRKAYGHPYRIGLALTYACELFRLTGDREWFKKQAAVLNSGADWIAAARRRTMRARAGRKPVHWGLLPKEFYGGDIHKRAYSLYPNAVCWRALRDLGLALQAAGESGASRWLEEAGAYRRRIRAAMRATQNRTVDPPFLSLKLYWRKPFPFSPTHYQLFLPMFMESWIVDLGGREAGCLADWLDANGKFFSGIPMLYPMRLDPVYGLGYAYAKLFSGRIDEYLSGVYTYLNAVMDRRFFTQPETGDLSLRPEDWAWEVRSESKSPAIWLHQSNPLPAAGAVVLLMLRHMLVAETRDAAGAADGGLLLAPALPRSWLAPGRRVAAQDLATHFGPVSYAVSVARDGRTIECRLDRAPGAGCRRIGWRLRLPRSASLAGARVSSARPADLDTTREGLWMPNPGKPARWVIGLRGGV